MSGIKVNKYTFTIMTVHFVGEYPATNDHDVLHKLLFTKEPLSILHHFSVHLHRRPQYTNTGHQS